MAQQLDGVPFVFPDDELAGGRVLAARLNVSLSRLVRVAISWAVSHPERRWPRWEEREVGSARAEDGRRTQVTLRLTAKDREQLELLSDQLLTSWDDAMRTALAIADRTPLEDLRAWNACALPPDARRRRAA